MALTHRILLVFFLLVALQTRAAWAAPWQAQGAVTDVPVGKAFPAPRLDPALEPRWRRRGPPRPKYQAGGGKKSPEPSEVLREILQELKRGHEMDQEAVQKEAFPEGLSGSLPVSAEETEALPVLSKSGEDHHKNVYEFFRADSDVVSEPTVNVPDPQSDTGFVCPQDVRRRCMIGTAAGAVSLPLTIVLCCVMIKRRRKAAQNQAAASRAHLGTGGHPSQPDSRTSRPSSPERWNQRQQPPVRPKTLARPPSRGPPRPPSPSPATLQWQEYEPSTLQPQTPPKRPPRPPSPMARPSSEDWRHPQYGRAWGADTPDDDFRD